MQEKTIAPVLRIFLASGVSLHGRRRYTNVYNDVLWAATARKHCGRNLWI